MSLLLKKYGMMEDASGIALMVISLSAGNGGSDTDYICTTDDFITAVARTSYGGQYLRYSSSLGALITTAGGTNFNAGVLNVSDDGGITWNKNEHTAAGAGGDYQRVVAEPVDIGSKLVLPTVWGNTRYAVSTSNGTSFAANSVGLPASLMEEMAVASDGTTGIFTNRETADAGNPDMRTTTDAITFANPTMTGDDWDSPEGDLIEPAIWIPSESLYFLQNDTQYWISADGTAWTEHTKPVGSGVKWLYFEELDALLYVVTDNGRTYYSSDSLVSFSTRNHSSGMGNVNQVVKVDSTYYAIMANGTGDMRFYSFPSTGITTVESWTRNTTFETSMESVLDNAAMNNGNARMVYVP